MVVVILWVLGFALLISSILTAVLGYYFMRLVRKTFNYTCRKLQKQNFCLGDEEMVPIYKPTSKSVLIPVPLS